MADDSASGSAGGDGTDDEIGAAVDDALTDEVKRQRARFVQAFMGMDRIEGVGRVDGELEDRETLDRRHRRDPDRPAD